MVLTDDMGYNYPGYKNSDVITPTLDSLAASGLKIPETYSYRFCSPSRGSFLTGRYPWRLPQSRCNFIPAYIMDGTPLGYTMLPARLAAKNYVSYHIGKWHQGLYAPQYTPTARGFNYSEGFLSGGEDHFTLTGDLSVGNCGSKDVGPQIRDSYVQNQTAGGLAGEYTGSRFTRRAVDLIHSHKATYGDAPLFLFLALHNTHSPLESTPQFLDLYPHVPFIDQKHYYAMVSAVDSAVSNVTTALKDAGLWNDTLFIWTTDNGAPVTVGGSNAPLRGSKGTNWEGGVKVPAFINGGVLPTGRRGKDTGTGVMSLVDWYSTLLAMAGLDPADPSPDAHAPIDSVNMWPWLSGQVPESPRSELVIDHFNFTFGSNLTGTSGALRQGKYKLLVGLRGGETSASWYGQFTPNASNPVANISYAACGNNVPPYGCLFDVEADPGEHIDLASALPDVFNSLLARFQSFNTSYHPPNNNPVSDQAGLCSVALLLKNNFTVAPWRTGQVPEGDGLPTCT
jgi:arylsulfatase I/J